MVVQPNVQGVHDRSTSLLPDLPPVLGRMSADLGFDGIERTDARQHLGGKRRLRGSIELVEVPPHMRPAERQADSAILLTFRQPLEPVVAIDLQHTAEG